MQVPGIGGRLREAREAAGLDQTEAGALVGAHRNTVQAWEKERQTIPVEYVAALAERSRLSGHWLLTGTGPRQPASEDSAQAKLEAIRRIIDTAPPASAGAASPDLERVEGGEAARSLSHREAVKQTPAEPPAKGKRRARGSGA